MKSLILTAALASIAAAQGNSSSNSTAPVVSQITQHTYTMNSGSGSIAESGASSTITVTPKQGSITITQALGMKPKGTPPNTTPRTPNPLHVFQSWVKLIGVGNNGSDVIAFANYSYDGSPVRNPVAKGCGIIQDMSQPGYSTVMQSLNTWECQLQVVQAIQKSLQDQVVQSATVLLTKTGNNKGLALRYGSVLSVQTGWNIYESNAQYAKIVDSWQGAPSFVTLEGALQGMAAGAASLTAAIALMNF